METDYYTILGIPRTADKTSIKKAYRKLAKQVHPDTSDGRRDQKKFLDAQQAYETLTDDVGRRQYDRSLRNREKHQSGQSIPVRVNRSGRRSTGAEFRQRPPVEDLIPEDAFSLRAVRKPFQTVRVRETIHLSAKEAREGLEMPVTLSFPVACPSCRNSLLEYLFHCPVCHGRGYRKTFRTVTLQIPAGVTPGQVSEVTLPDTGPFPIILELTVAVESTR